MLPKKQKLPRGQFTIGRHTIIKKPCFTVKIKLNNLPYPRIGVVVSNAAVKSAVKRNFLKRQTKAIFKDRAREPKDFVVIFNSRAKSLTKKDLQTELGNVF
jgi:ribonuclease P protein component